MTTPCPVCGRQPRLSVIYSDPPVYELSCRRSAKNIGHGLSASGPDEFVAAKRWKRLCGGKAKKEQGK